MYTLLLAVLRRPMTRQVPVHSTLLLPPAFLSFLLLTSINLMSVSSSTFQVSKVTPRQFEERHSDKFSKGTALPIIPSELIVEILSRTLDERPGVYLPTPRQTASSGERNNNSLLCTYSLISRQYKGWAQKLLFSAPCLEVVNRKQVEAFLRTVEGARDGVAEDVKAIRLDRGDWDDPTPCKVGKEVARIAKACPNIEVLSLVEVVWGDLSDLREAINLKTLWFENMELLRPFSPPTTPLPVQHLILSGLEFEPETAELFFTPATWPNVDTLLLGTMVHINDEDQTPITPILKPLLPQLKHLSAMFFDWDPPTLALLQSIKVLQMG